MGLQECLIHEGEFPLLGILFFILLEVNDRLESWYISKINGKNTLEN